MSEAKFTGGEWAINKNSDFDGRWSIDTGSHYRSVDVVVCFEGEEHDCATRLRLEANAHLIAAAPEMYEMLEAAWSEMHSLIDEVNDQRASRITSQTEAEPDYHDQETLHLIQKLLAKARGEV